MGGIVDENVTQAPAENIEAVEDNSPDTSPVDETNTSVDEQGVDAPSQDAPAEEPTERKPSRAEQRIRTLAEENKRLREQSYQPPAFDQSLQFPQYQPGEEIAPERLQADVVQTAQAIASAQVQSHLQQYEAKANLERDVEVLEAAYPELSEDSGNPALISKIEERFKREAFRNGQLDPTVRLAAIAKEEVDFARAIATSASAQTQKAVAVTADETAIRPGGEVKQDKSASEMSIEEMEAKYGMVRA